MVPTERADRVAAAVNRQAARLKNHRIGRCPACGGPVYRCDRPMRLHGEVFHRECARYRPEIAGDADALAFPWPLLDERGDRPLVA